MAAAAGAGVGTGVGVGVGVGVGAGAGVGVEVGVDVGADVGVVVGVDVAVVLGVDAGVVAATANGWEDAAEVEPAAAAAGVDEVELVSSPPHAASATVTTIKAVTVSDERANFLDIMCILFCVSFQAVQPAMPARLEIEIE